MAAVQNTPQHFPTHELPIEEIMTRVHPDDTERSRAAIEASLDPVKQRRAATEFRLRRGGGEIRWVEAHGLAYFEGAGHERRAVSSVGTVADITERKEREEDRRKREKKVQHLMREVNHRSRNILSVVYAIARQTATKNPEDFIERFSERIQALSANQDRSCETSGMALRSSIWFVPNSRPSSTSLVLVSPCTAPNWATSAQAIGLALHELATNAGKYGALSRRKGRVDICWRTDGQTLTMSWTECDGPPVSMPSQRGFGPLAEYSLDGTVELDDPPSGLTWRLTCPIAKVLEAWERRSNLRGTGKSN